MLILFLTITTLTAIVVLLSFAITSFQAERSGAPFFPTPRKYIEEGLRVAGLKKGEVLYDLGSGTGRVLIISAKQFSARAHGFELSTLFYLISRINIFLSKAHAKIYRRDFYRTDLSEADVIFCFLVPRGLKRLEKKLENELRPGSRVVSYIFPFPSWQPTKIIKFSDSKKAFVYFRN
ncbi:MAG: SAM-dependent methyltransferase [Candidatus Liptonbacteria bacterium]|nr:SAM-dependent methyltransferase [Candidatus Liptonbacteria bacterium]